MDTPGTAQASPTPPAPSISATLWRERCLSPWAPVSALGLGLLAYLPVVELSPASAAKAQPAMKGFGLLCLLGLAVLSALRVGQGPFARARRLRHEAHEARGEYVRLLKRAGPRATATAREELSRGVERLDAAYVGADLEALQKETAGLARLVDKHFATFRRNSTVEFLLGFGRAFAIAMAIRTVAIEPFKIPSGSMIPTLQIGDQIFVNKFIYGVRIPWVNRVPFQVVRAPVRGDVIVFENPLNPSKDFVKRVVAVGGDSVAIRHDVVFINGQAMPRRLVDARHRYMDQDYRSGTWHERQAALFEEDLSGHRHALLQDEVETDRSYNGGEAFTVPAGTVFVLGDNRDNSSDSRFGLGEYPGMVEHLSFVPLGHIKGKAMVTWLALGHGGLLSGLFGGTGFNTERLFRPVR